jgi:hypothetical protein
MGKNVKQYNQDYYQKNKEHILKRFKERYHDPNSGTRESVLNYQEGYRDRNREQIRARDRDKLKNLKAQVEQLFKKECIICGETKGKMDLHEVHGKPHSNSWRKKYTYILEHKEDFVWLCHDCHSTVHKLAKLFTRLDKVLELVKLINCKEPQSLNKTAHSINNRKG